MTMKIFGKRKFIILIWGHLPKKLWEPLTQQPFHIELNKNGKHYKKKNKIKKDY